MNTSVGSNLFSLAGTALINSAFADPVLGAFNSHSCPVGDQTLLVVVKGPVSINQCQTLHVRNVNVSY